MTAPVDTTVDTLERVLLVAKSNVFHVSGAYTVPLCKDMQALGGKLSYGSAAAITCTCCRRAYEKERRG